MKLDFLAYYFFEEDGVGALRSISLYNLLLERNKQVNIINRKSFNLKSNNFLIWSFFCFIQLVKSKSNLIYVSCGPFLHLPFVLIACKIKQKKLIVDFRDPWSINIKRGYGNNKRKRNLLKAIIAEFIEKKVYSQCTYFIVCTDGMKQEYSELFKSEEKIIVILNGHNIEFEESTKKEDNLKFAENQINFVCLGKFAEYSEEKARYTLNEIKENCFKYKQNYKIHFIGGSEQINSRVLDSVGLLEHAVFYPRLSYNKALKIAKKCDIGLIIIRDEEIDYGTKIYDYIGLGIPVYDCFEKEGNFRKKFLNYLCKNSIVQIESIDRKRYSRKELFKSFLKLFDQE